jgi:hypothetical protein
VKLAMTLVVRNEADILDAQLQFHFAAGVDVVIAVDHGSTDGTGEILDSYAKQGRLHVVRHPGVEFRQAEWVTEMARLALTAYGADWVIHPDADEFWWPRGGTLKHVLSAVPDRFGVVYGFCRTFPPRPGTGPFAERMIARLVPAGPLNNPATTFRPWLKVAHRCHPDAVVALGNHRVVSDALAPIAGWYPIEILHFNIRSYEQFERKARAHHTVIEGQRRGDAAEAMRAGAAGRLRELFARLCVDDDVLERGLAQGVLAIDTRLRDALGAIAAGGSPDFGRREASNASLLAESTAADDVNLVRAYRRLDFIERRVAAAEALGVAARARRPLRSRRRA